jgi:hypothetical protein
MAAASATPVSASVDDRAYTHDDAVIERIRRERPWLTDPSLCVCARPTAAVTREAAAAPDAREPRRRLRAAPSSSRASA